MALEQAAVQVPGGRYVGTGHLIVFVGRDSAHAQTKKARFCVLGKKKAFFYRCDTLPSYLQCCDGTTVQALLSHAPPST